MMWFCGAGTDCGIEKYMEERLIKKKKILMIASLTGMSRSAVQRHRTKTLKELRVKLMALMPEGG